MRAITRFSAEADTDDYLPDEHDLYGVLAMMRVADSPSPYFYETD
jgi:hypothetical protein